MHVKIASRIVSYHFVHSKLTLMARITVILVKKLLSSCCCFDWYMTCLCVCGIFVHVDRKTDFSEIWQKNNMAAVELTPLCPGLPGWAGSRKIKPMWILLRGHFVGFAHYPKRLYHGTWDNEWNCCSGRELTQNTELPMTRMVRSACSQAVSSA